MRRALATLVTAALLMLVGTIPASADTHYSAEAATVCHGTHVNVGYQWFRFWSGGSVGSGVIKVAWTVRTFHVDPGPQHNWDVEWKAIWRTDTWTKSSGVISEDTDYASGEAADDRLGLFSGQANAPISAHPWIEMYAGRDGDGYGVCFVVAEALL